MKKKKRNIKQNKLILMRYAIIVTLIVQKAKVIYVYRNMKNENIYFVLYDPILMLKISVMNLFCK